MVINNVTQKKCNKNLVRFFFCVATCHHVSTKNFSTSLGSPSVLADKLCGNVVIFFDTFLQWVLFSIIPRMVLFQKGQRRAALICQTSHHSIYLFIPPATHWGYNMSPHDNPNNLLPHYLSPRSFGWKEALKATTTNNIG